MTGQPDWHPDEFSARVRRREQRRLDPGRRERKIFFGLGMLGMVGWSVTIPAVAATFLGVWLDAHLASRFSWTLTLMGIGLGVGCANAWYWLQKERRAIVDEQKRGES